MQTAPHNATREAEAADWLRRHQPCGTSSAEALRFFDSLPAASLDEMMGRWRGSGLATAHPMDGLLEAYGWYGKDFQEPDFVHPLLFRAGNGRIVPVNSRYIPHGLMSRATMSNKLIASLPALMPLALALISTQKPTARLRLMSHRSQNTATMIYDFLPIHDHFHRVDSTTLLGLMDLRAVPQPFFFTLQRDNVST